MSMRLGLHPPELADSAVLLSSTFPNLGRPIAVDERVTGDRAANVVQAVGRYARLLAMNHVHASGAHSEQFVDANPNIVGSFLGYGSNVSGLAWIDYHFREIIPILASPELRAVYDEAGKAARSRPELMEGKLKRLPVQSLFVVDRISDDRGNLTGIELATASEIKENGATDVLRTWLDRCDPGILFAYEHVQQLRRHVQ